MLRFFYAVLLSLMLGFPVYALNDNTITGNDAIICTGDNCSITNNEGVSKEELIKILDSLLIDLKDAIKQNSNNTDNHHLEKILEKLEAQKISINKNNGFRDFVDALISGDDKILKGVGYGDVSTAMLGNALGAFVDGNNKSAAYLFFKATRNNAEAILWFTQMLKDGLDPNLTIVYKNGEQKSILTQAIAAGNLPAMRSLLEAGASPHSIQSLDGFSGYWPEFLNPLRYLVRQNSSLLGEEKAEAVRLLIDFGAPLPSKMLRGAEGEMQLGSLNEKGIIHDDYFEPAKALGIERVSTQDLCDNPQPDLCARASRVYGYDWCGFIKSLPKGIVGSGEGAYHVSPIFLQYLISIDATSAYFLDMGGSSAYGLGGHLRIVQVSKDRNQIHVMSYKEHYPCKYYCWGSELLRRNGEGFNYKYGSWGATFRPFDTCSAIAAYDKELQSTVIDTSWIDEITKNTESFDQYARAKIRSKLAPLQKEFYERAAFDAFWNDQRVLMELSKLALSYPGETQQIISWQSIKSDKSLRGAFLGYLFDRDRSWKRSFMNDYADQRGLVLFGREISQRQFDFVKAEVISITKEILKELRTQHVTKRFYLTSKLESLHYDFNRNVLMSDKGLFTVRPQIDDPIFLPAGAKADSRLRYKIVPDVARGHYLYYATPNTVPLRWSAPSLRQQEELREFSWAPQYENYGLTIDILALDQKIQLAEFNLKSEVAERYLSGPGIQNSKGDWRLVAIVTQQDAKYVEFSFDDGGDNFDPGRTVLFASLEEILLIAPNNEIVSRIRYSGGAK